MNSSPSKTVNVGETSTSTNSNSSSATNRNTNTDTNTVNTNSSNTNRAQASLAVLFQISELLATGLTKEQLASCVALCELGANPEALAAVVKELRREFS